jgi:hypothetical protein
MPLMVFFRLPEIDAELEVGDVFATPVPVPVDPIDAPDLACLTYNKAYGPIIALALSRLLYYDAWTGTDTDIQRATRQMEHLIGNVLSEDCVACEPESPELSACTSIGPFHPSVEFWPNHPILSPDYIPPGADAPLWRTGAGLPFVDENDAILNPLAIFTPVILTENWSIGVPSIRLHFSGQGEVTLTLTKAVQGCIAWIFPDGNPLLGQPVNLSLISIDDIFGLEWITSVLDYFTGGVGTEVLHRVEFTTPGEHTLTIWMLPVQDEFPFVGFGGGLRRVDYCGEITLEDEIAMPYSIVRNGCNIELKLEDAVVSTIEDVFYTDAVCDITDTTQIIKTLEAQDATLLRLRRRGNTASNTGNIVQFTNQTSAGNDSDSVRFRTFLVNNVAGSLYAAMQIIGTVLGGGGVVMAVFGQLANFWVNQWGALRGIVVRQQSGATGAMLELVDQANESQFTVANAGSITTHFKDTVTNSPQAALTVNARASGITPAAGFGSRLDMKASSSTTPNRDMARIEALWATATDAARGAEMRLRVHDYLGSVVPFRVQAQDGVSALAFHNTAPITKRIHTAVTEFEAIEEINATLSAYGLITDSTDVTADEGAGGEGPAGPAGPAGPTGPTGPAGPTGECIDCGQPAETPGEDTFDKKCNIASYLVDLVLPDMVDQILDEQATASSVISLVSFVLAVLATFAAGPAGFAIGSGIAGFISILFGLDNATIEAEIDGQYWEDVRCRLLGSVPLDGILSPDALEVMALSVENIASKPNMNAFLPALLRNFTGGFAGQVSVLGSLYEGDCSLCPVEDCGFTGLFDDSGLHENVSFSLVKLSDFSVRVVFEYQNTTSPPGLTWYNNQFIFIEIEEGCDAVTSFKVVYERPPSGFNKNDPAPGECDHPDSSLERAYNISLQNTNNPPTTINTGQDEIELIWGAANPAANGLRVLWSGCRFVNNANIHHAETIIRITEVNGLPTGA